MGLFMYNIYDNIHPLIVDEMYVGNHNLYGYETPH